MEINGILLALAAMAGWGILDFLIAHNVRKTEPVKAIFWMRATASLILLGIILLFERNSITMPSISPWLLLLIAGIINTTAWISFSTGLKKGKATLLAPIANSWALVTILIGLFVLHEKLLFEQFVLIGVILSGIILASVENTLWKKEKIEITGGVSNALLAMVCWGVYFILLSVFIKELGLLISLCILYVISALLLGIYATIKRISLIKNVHRDLLFTGTLDSMAFLVEGACLIFIPAVIAAPIITASPVITVLLAQLVFKDRIRKHQILGIVLIIVGIGALTSLG